ncbi:MAG: ferritin-like domain-containing protein, partial [Bdellovibrionaceae bacterium]|nr:ferritin-like domain-containing protein [Pseudobdellovibrionaceae bacterium]
DWPVHDTLWAATSSSDSLLDRILIVHRYLEGSGLDAGSQLLRRLQVDEEGTSRLVVEQIVREEVGHVEFGSRWYREICRSEGLDPELDFPRRMKELRWQLPRRTEKIVRELRRKAGFSEAEIDYLEELRREFLSPLKILSGDIKHH